MLIKRSTLYNLLYKNKPVNINFFYFFIALYIKYARPPYITIDPKINIIIADGGSIYTSSSFPFNFPRMIENKNKISIGTKPNIIKISHL